MLTSSMLPTDTKCEKPIPSSMAQSSTDVQSAPDWEMKPMCPGAGVMAAKLALRCSRGTMIPRQLGPRIRMPSNLRCSSADGFFQFAAGLARLAEPGREDDDARTPFSPHDRTIAGTIGGRRADHGQIGDGGNALDVLVGLDALHRLVLGIDRIDHAPIVGGDQIAKDRVADAGRRFVGPDDGDAVGIEDFVEIADAHGGQPGLLWPGDHGGRVRDQPELK